MRSTSRAPDSTLRSTNRSQVPRRGRPEAAGLRVVRGLRGEPVRGGRPLFDPGRGLAVRDVVDGREHLADVGSPVEDAAEDVLGGELEVVVGEEGPHRGLPSVLRCAVLRRPCSHPVQSDSSRNLGAPAAVVTHRNSAWSRCGRAGRREH